MSLQALFSTKEEVSLMIDIGNGSVAGAFVVFSGSKKPLLLYTVRMPFSVEPELDSEKLVQSLGVLLDGVLTTLMKKGFLHEYWEKREKKISAVLVSFSSPWFVSKQKHVHVEKESTFVISKSFLDNILNTEKKTFETEVISETKVEKIQVIEDVILTTQINGYHIAESIGKKTKVFDASLYMAVLPKPVIDLVYKYIFKHTHIHEKNIHLHSFSLIAFTVMRDMYPMQENFLFLDVTSEVTDLTLVSGGEIVHATSFPSGRNFIIRQIAKKSKVSTEIAESLLHNFIEKKTDEQTSEQMEAIFNDIEKEWAIYFEDTYTELSKNATVSSRVFITAQDDVLPIYDMFLKLPKTDNTATFRKNIQITHIDQTVMSAVFTPNAHFQSDEFIALLAVFYNTVK